MQKLVSIPWQTCRAVCSVAGFPIPATISLSIRNSRSGFDRPRDQVVVSAVVVVQMERAELALADQQRLRSAPRSFQRVVPKSRPLLLAFASRVFAHSTAPCPSRRYPYGKTTVQKKLVFDAIADIGVADLPVCAFKRFQHSRSGASEVRSALECCCRRSSRRSQPLRPPFWRRRCNASKPRSSFRESENRNLPASRTVVFVWKRLVFSVPKVMPLLFT